MKAIKRQSAVQFDAQIEKTEERDNWKVVLQYQNEGKGPWLVDLAHKARFDLQDGLIDQKQPEGITIPDVPGMSVYEKSILVNRMNATQASIYCLANEIPPFDGDNSYTDVSEATVFLALFGKNVFLVAEKLTSLDFLAPDKNPPFLYQGPFCHVPCQIVTLQRNSDGSGGILLSCSRGYAESMVESILDSGSEFGLQPVGEDKFSEWVETL